MKNRRRNKQIIVRTTEEEYLKIMEKVKVSEMTMNRFFINAALRKEIIVFNFESLFELSAQVSRIGNNINQIARKLNQGGLSNKNEMDFLKDSLTNINIVMLQIYHDIKELQDKE
nr:plasmid mobilization relaxosome protein MobC [Sedimentibacter sp.]